MADALVSVILEQLASIIHQQAEQEFISNFGVKKEVRKLTSNFHAIQDVLEDAERKQVKNATVKQWLAELKDVSYDIDDVLDEWNTEILKMQIERDENAPRPKRKLCYFVLSCFCYKQVAWRRDIAIKIKDLSEQLDVIAHEKSTFNFTVISGAEESERSMTTFVIERSMTSSVIDVSQVHGRDHDKNTIINMLLSESSQGSNLHIISIVGMGGIGKTTLAQLVFNDDNVKAHFQNRIWVCVSDPFVEIRIAKAILEDLNDNAPNLNELNSLLRRISDSVKGKKFLLVLDDVWTEDYRKWEQLKNSLNCGLPGSRILVTTRKETVAKIIRTTNMFPLGKLSNEECWSLFSQVALFGRSREECKNLEEIGRSITDKCKGLPLAIKALGSLLSFRKTKQEWQSVLDSEVWELEEAERGIFPPLLLSYYDLSFTMRRCFLYCAIFPKDYKMEKNRLIKLWMAQGYLRAIGNRDMEMVGEDCFRNLAMRSFFQDFEKDENDQIITCKMHDIVHDFAQFLTENECVVIEGNGLGESRLDSSHVKARHSMFMRAENESFATSIKNIKKLRSLIVEWNWNARSITNATLSEVFVQLTCLRTLDLSKSFGFGLGCGSILPKEVGKLIHLRYLNLAHNEELKELPETVCDLCNLQTLNVSRCRALEKLPPGLGKLINLRHLEIWGTKVKFMPKGVEKLTSLRTLDTFYVNDIRTLDTIYVSSGVNDSEVSNIGDLKNLNHLRGQLWIKGLGKVRDVDEVKKAQLKNKQHLISLLLDFEEKEAVGRMINDEEVIEALQLPPNLEKLQIWGYKDTNVSPNWMMSLTNLKTFRIANCHKLEALSDNLLHLTSLKELGIGNCPILKERYYKEREGEDWPKISHIPNIIIGHHYVQKEGHFLQTPEETEFAKSYTTIRVNFGLIIRRLCLKQTTNSIWRSAFLAEAN